MDIHFEICYEISNRILDTFDCTNFANRFHDIAHTFSFYLDDDIVKSEKFVRFRYGSKFADFAKDFVFLLGSDFDENICFVNQYPLLCVRFEQVIEFVCVF